MGRLVGLALRALVGIALICVVIWVALLFINGTTNRLKKSGVDISDTVGKAAESVNKFGQTQELDPVKLAMSSQTHFANAKHEMLLGINDGNVSAAMQQANANTLKAINGDPMAGDIINVAVFDPNTKNAAGSDCVLYVSQGGEPPVKYNIPAGQSIDLNLARGQSYEIHGDCGGIPTGSRTLIYTGGDTKVDLWLRR